MVGNGISEPSTVSQLAQICYQRETHFLCHLCDIRSLAEITLCRPLGFIKKRQEMLVCHGNSTRNKGLIESKSVFDSHFPFLRFANVMKSLFLVGWMLVGFVPSFGRDVHGLGRTVTPETGTPGL